MSGFKPTRRHAIYGGALAAIAGGIAVMAPVLLRKRYAPSPYDDLLDLLDNRDADAQIGEAVLADKNDFGANEVAAALRARIGKRPLAEVMADDAAEGRVVEADRWVLPETLAMLCALAAKANG